MNIRENQRIVVVFTVTVRLVMRMRMFVGDVGQPEPDVMVHSTKPCQENGNGCGGQAGRISRQSGANNP